MIDTEILIVGGGPAGSSCARKLREAGRDVVILERETFPRTKLCAGWIMPEVLRDLELTPESYPHGIVTLKRLHLNIYGLRLPVPTTQYSIRRFEFDDFLLRRSGAEVYLHSVKEIRIENGHYIVDDAFRCRFLVGAGGTSCPVYRTLFEAQQPRDIEAFIVTVEEEFAYEAEDRRCLLWFSERKLAGYSWYVPKAGGFVNIGIGGKLADLKKRGESIREHWDFFTEKLRRRGLVREHDFNPRGHNYYFRKENLEGRIGDAFIIGDAAGLATLDMGEGIGPAVRSGFLAADSILLGKNFSLESIGKYSFYHRIFPWV